MTIQDKISQLLPSFLRRYDGNKNAVIALAGEGTLERYQKMLASEIDGFFLVNTDNLHKNTKAVTMPTKFLPYEEDLRGTAKLVFEFATPTLDETNLIFDFDFEQIGKMTIVADEFMQFYEDRGYTMEQPVFSSAFIPYLDLVRGLYFDGVQNFMQIIGIQPEEIWLVCNSPKVAFDGDGESLFGDGTGYACIGNGTTIVSIIGASKINNIFTADFAPLSQYKTVSDIIAGYGNLFIAGAHGYVNFNGHIKRILLFDVVRTEAQRTQLQAYLALKYGL